MRANPRSRSRGPNPELSRMRLLVATSRLCGESGSEPIVIEDILRAAGISRGTFYAHFDSLNDVLAAIAERLFDDLRMFLKEFYRDQKDPVFRLAASLQAGIMRASIEPLWGRALAAWGWSSASGRDYKTLQILIDFREQIERGREAGIFQYDDIRAIMDVHVGMCIQAARALQTLKTGQRAYIEQIAIADLRALGVPNTRARQAVRWASDDLRTRASKSPGWRAIGVLEPLPATELCST